LDDPPDLIGLDPRLHFRKLDAGQTEKERRCQISPQGITVEIRLCSGSHGVSLP